MGLGSFLFGSSGGMDKEQKRRLQEALDLEENATYETQTYGGGKRFLKGLSWKVRKADPYKVDPRFLDYANKMVQPGFNRARARVAEQYASADAPISSGGRTQAEIGLAGEESGLIAQLVEQERQAKRQRAMQLLAMLSQPKPASQGFLGGLGSSFSFTKAI